MPRRNRFAPPDFAHHVVNRGNDRRIVFRQEFDYTAFMDLMRDGLAEAPVRIYGYCLMPNHFHLLAQPEKDGALSAYMEWVTGRYACTFRQQTDTVGYGHVFKCRFWSFPTYDQDTFIDVLRYVEANPLRARLVARAEDWVWGSLADRATLHRGVLSPLPFALPANWVECVNTPQADLTLTKIRELTFPKRGRPRKDQKERQPALSALPSVRAATPAAPKKGQPLF